MLLHDGVPDWMSAPFWAWVRDAITVHRTYKDGSGRVAMLATDLTEQMCQGLQIPRPNLRVRGVDPDAGRRQLRRALETLRVHEAPLQIADYLLAHEGRAKPEDLDALLERSKSAGRWISDRDGQALSGGPRSGYRSQPTP